MTNILLVDDEVTERNGIRFLIEKFELPLHVSEASNGKLALEHIQNHPVDILFTDVKMPYMDGLELAKQVQLRRPAIKTIIFSAHSDFEYAKKALEANAVNYLLKPIEVEEFKVVMRDAIESCRLQKRDTEREVARQEADRMQLLFQELTGANLQVAFAQKEVLASEGEFFVLVHIETRNSLFANSEEQFLHLVKTYCPHLFTYVNLYPNAAYLILRGDTRPDLPGLERFADKLYREVQHVCGDTCSILLGPSFTDRSLLREQAKALEELRLGIYEGDSGVLVAERLADSGSYYADGVEECREQIVEAIRNSDHDEIALQIGRLLLCLHKAQALSVVYLHHIFYDLLTRIYQGSGIYDNRLIHRRIEEAVRCTSYEELTGCFQEILREISHSDEMADSRGLVRRVDAIIESDYAKDIGLDYIGEKVNLSPAYLCFLYKQETGANIIKQLSDYRMKKARELLLDTNLKIAEIARQCGYENPSYFNRLFKNLYGAPPRQYREQPR